MSDFVNIILLALLGSVIALFGGVVFLFVKKWSDVLTRYSVPFAAGVLITAALLGILPEAVDVVGERGFVIALLTFVGAYLFENMVCDLHHHDHSHSKSDKFEGSIPLVLAGDTIHNFIDGVAIAASYLVNPGLGLVTAVSTFLHEVPHEIGDFGILLKAGWKRNKILMVNFISAMFTVVGALVVWYFARGEAFSGYLLSGAAGLFLYLGASDFLPHADEDLSRKKAMTVLVFGVLLMWSTLKIVPHSHDLHEGEESHEICEHEEHIEDVGDVDGGLEHELIEIEEH